MELRADKDKLDNEITAITTAIEKEKAEWMKEKKGGKDKEIIDFHRESIAALRTDKGKLIDSRDKLQHDIATQPSQGKSTHCQHVVTSLCHYVADSQTHMSSLCQSVC
jgi:hypothetical protein